jgi:hypothetical protein
MEKPLLRHLLPERLEGCDLTSGGERRSLTVWRTRGSIGRGLTIVQRLQWIQQDLGIHLTGREVESSGNGNYY